MANRNLQQEVLIGKEPLEVIGGEDQSCCPTTCSTILQPQQYLRIATWPKVSPILEEYATAYNSLNPEAPKILIDTIPSIRDLQDNIEITKASLAIDASARVDGYVVPPMLLGTLAEELASLEQNSELKYLPIYDHLTTVDGRKAALPLFSGNQLLLFYNKNILGDLPPPNTWTEVANVAKTLHNGPVSGLCLGRMSEEQCRQKSSQTGLPCHSQSMSYWSMILASLAQSQGPSDGWLFYVNNNGGKIIPLLNATMGPTLDILKEQVLYGAPNALESDATMDLEAFRQGNCAMTILAEHPTDLLKDPNVGYAALPGSSLVLNRPPTVLQECTFRNCPHGQVNSNQQGEGEGVNRAPLGAMDIAMGTILESSLHQTEMQDFFNFVQFDRPKSMEGRQPLTYVDLQALVENDVQMQEYADLIESAASDPNAVWPLTIPASFDLMSELDQQVYNYLSGDNHTADASKDLVRKVEKTWGIRIQQQDSRSMHSTPLSILYQRSLQGVAVEQKVNLYIGTGFRIAGWTMGGIACAMAVGFAIWVYIYQDSRVVRASQPLFLWLICAGAFIMASCIFPFGLEDDIVSFEASSIACMSGVWLYGLGFVMLVSALYSKIWRINLIFRYQYKIREIRIEKKHIMVPFGSLFSINFVLLMIWTIVDPYEWIREEVNIGFTNGFCSSDHYRVFVTLLVFINLLVSFYTLIQAFECRKLSTEYDESLWIGASLVCIVQVSLIALPILVITGSTPDWLFLTKVCVVFFTCVCTLLCIFVPKIRFLRKEAKEQELDGSDRNNTIVCAKKHFQSAFGMIRFGSTNMVTGPSEEMQQRSKRSSGVIGIRIVRSSGEHTQDLERLQNNLKNAEGRKRTLQDQMESLQDQFEQYVVSTHQPRPSKS